MHVPEILPHKAVLFIINQNYENARRLNTPDPIYESVRFAWHVDKSRVEKADYVLAVDNGTIIGAFIADEWTIVDADAPPRLRRYAFVGREAPQSVHQELYVGRPVPDSLKRRWSRNPVKYANC